jgi:biopolymer transport protein ExbD
VPRSTLQARLDQRTIKHVFPRADGTVAYNTLVKVMNLLRDAG